MRSHYPDWMFLFVHNIMFNLLNNLKHNCLYLNWLNPIIADIIKDRCDMQVPHELSEDNTETIVLEINNKEIKSEENLPRTVC